MGAFWISRSELVTTTIANLHDFGDDPLVTRRRWSNCKRTEVAIVLDGNPAASASCVLHERHAQYGALLGLLHDNSIGSLWPLLLLLLRLETTRRQSG
jgi:hypothetical protein